MESYLRIQMASFMPNRMRTGTSRFCKLILRSAGILPAYFYTRVLQFALRAWRELTPMLLPRRELRYRKRTTVARIGMHPCALHLY
jgi:hypothetical protein